MINDQDYKILADEVYEVDNKKMIIHGQMEIF